MIREAQKNVLKNKVKYYPSEALKKKLNDYALQTGEYKSELAVRLAQEFFEAKRKESFDHAHDDNKIKDADGITK